MRGRMAVLVALGAWGFGLADGGAAAPRPAAAPSAKTAPVVRVNSTNQPFDFARPWAKKPPFLRRGTGAVLEGGRVLVTAELVANHSYVEIEKPVGAEKSPARVLAVDYDANLALLEPADAGFLKGLGSFHLAGQAAIGEAAEILQLEPSGEIARTPATITSITVAPYPFESAALMVFRLSSPLQSRDNSFVLPAARNGELLGMLMRYDARSQMAEIVPFPIIRNFLERAREEPFAGLPRAGFSFAPLRDPALRRFLNLQEPGGVYLTEVLEGSPAAEAGLRRGDVVLSLGGKKLDADGLYDDSKFGKLLFTHLISTHARGQGPLELVVFREGQVFPVQLTPAPRDPA
ncbi:MAG: PDZ domain-containing protein, partial [Terrimicrobiaceae bacterium]|nr:PDZ domain-containing protein [Terrimicrobiaceae bacterium]